MKMNYYTGLDVSKNTLDLGWLRDLESNKVKTKSKLPNTPKGHQQISQWLQKTIGASPQEIVVCLEVTGVYHEAVCLFLYQEGFQVMLANPGKARKYAESRGTLHKTDKHDSIMLAHYGASLDPHAVLWEPEPSEARELKALLRRLSALESDLMREQNRQEAADNGIQSEQVKVSLENMIERIRAEMARLTRDIDDHIDRHPQLKKNRELMLSVRGVGPVISRELVALFACNTFENARQVAAYIGLIPKLIESGTFKGRSRMSKRGDKRIRAKLYMAAVSATQHNPDIIHQRQRLLRAGKTKMQALGASMRKLVQICFGVVKHQSEYQPQVAFAT